MNGGTAAAGRARCPTRRSRRRSLRAPARERGAARPRTPRRPGRRRGSPPPRSAPAGISARSTCDRGPSATRGTRGSIRHARPVAGRSTAARLRPRRDRRRAHRASDRRATRARGCRVLLDVPSQMAARVRKQHLVDEPRWASSCPRCRGGRRGCVGLTHARRGDGIRRAEADRLKSRVDAASPCSAASSPTCPETAGSPGCAARRRGRTSGACRAARGSDRRPRPRARRPASPGG